MTPPPAQSLFCLDVLLPGGWEQNVRLEIDAGKFSKVERGATKRAGEEVVIAAVPGIGNVHSHGFQRGMAGLTEYRGPEADNFWSWRELMYRFVGRMTPDDLEAVTAQAYVEMLEGGFTRVGEFHYVHHDVAGKPYADRAEMASRVAAAAATTGIGLTLLPVFYAHGNFGGAAPTEGQRRFINDVDGFARLLEASRRSLARLPDAVLGVAPHSLRAVTPEELKRVITLGGAGPIQIHAAEQVKEVEDCVAWSGARPVQWLLDNAAVDARWCLVHATHMTGDEITRLARSGAVAGFCPITEANLGDGISPAAPYLAAGGTFGIGTDSNVLISVSEELRLLEYSQRLRDRARNVLAAQSPHSTGRTLFVHAHRGGARALGVPGPAGADGILPGASADLVAVLPSMESRRSVDVILDGFIFASGKVGVTDVWRAGRKVVSSGIHHARGEVQARFRAVVQRLAA